MTEASIERLPVRPWTVAAVFFLALSAALFFHGFRSDFFCATQFLLLIWVFVVVWEGCRPSISGDSVFVIPRSTLVVLVALYWGWLAVTLFWTPVPNYSKVSFWWMGSLPLVFGAYSLAPAKEQLWRATFPLILLLAFLLASHGIFQFFVKNWEPKSVFLDINSYAAFLALVALPVGGHFSNFLESGVKKRTATVLAFVIFILSFAIVITGGRGVLLAFLVSFSLLLIVSLRHGRKLSVILLTSLVTTAVVIGNVAARGRTVERLITVLDPAKAGFERYLIWDSTWQMVMQSPWFGTGLGTFGLMFPPFQKVEDSSAGFWVHNDYLQLWLEAGLPALLLLLAIFAVALVLLIRVLRDRTVSANRRIEITGLFCGLLAIAMHSFVNFNLYILPTLIVAGLILARFHWLAHESLGSRVLIFDPTRYLVRPVFRLVVGLLLLMPVLYFLALTLSTSYNKEGVALAAAAKFDEADAALTRARRLSPDADMVLVSQADLYRHVISVAPAESIDEKRQLFASAVELLDEASRLNRYRPITAFVRARLYRQGPELAGPDWQTKTINAYERAIALQPRFYAARVEYAYFLLQLERHDRARNVLEQGIVFPYGKHERLLPYYRLTMQLRRVAGDSKGAEELATRIADIEATPPEHRPIPLEQFKFLSVRELFQALLFWQRPPAEPVDILTPTVSSPE